MFKQNVLVRKNQPIIISVRMVAGDEFFCSTYLGYGGENYKTNQKNEECAFDVTDTAECTKGETDTTFGQVPRIYYFDTGK